MKKTSLFLRAILLVLLFSVSTLQADEMDDGFSDGGDDPFGETSSGDDAFSDEGASDVFSENDSDETSEGDSDESSDEEEGLFTGFSGKLTQQMALAYSNDKAQDIYSSLRSTLFLNYTHKFENEFAIKLTGRAFYDGKYDSLNGIYTQEQINELRTEVEIFEGYINGSIIDGLDFKVGRQIEVWGRSDTIRVTDILNPVDNRRPGLLDVEDLRLPRGLAKLDYYIGDWRISPIVVLEDRFTKIPPFGSTYNPFPDGIPKDKKYSDFGYALSVGYEGSGWDMGLYFAHVRDDFPYISFATDTKKFDNGENPFSLANTEHSLMDMLGGAFNIVSGSWLFKSEFAYFKTGNFVTDFSRFDGLFGFEYTGFSGVIISYDVSGRSFFDYDKRLKPFGEALAVGDVALEHAFRINRDWVNATVHTSYLVFLYGLGFNEGGFHRLAVDYDLADGLKANLSFIDYIPGSVIFNLVQDEYVIASDISYTF